ncbi:NifU family protein [Halobacteriovorax sp. HLS]|uniref:NifU family protein n=1 Tax=Halobacteriovorax sp. HLS TaxID=2234000 RepID=UPI000FD7FC3F|nr:NifU family protein [Halobacteriovorax sp. HLS]
MIRKVEALFDDQIRPALAAHGGNVEVIDIDNGKLFVKLSGGCQGCTSSSATLKDGIEKLIKQNFSEIEEVVDLTDHQSGDNPYFS